MVKQSYLKPLDLFVGSDNTNRQWTCVRTRPRWEKRFAHWLEANNKQYYMPVVEKRTRSYRKTRQTQLPLFPGYVFVIGEVSKKEFIRSEAVVYVLNAKSEQEYRELDMQISSTWSMLASGENPLIVKEWQPGELVEVIAGPMMGTTGHFVRYERNGELIVWVDMLGAGISVKIDDPEVLQPLSDISNATKKAQQARVSYVANNSSRQIGATVNA